MAARSSDGMPRYLAICAVYVGAYVALDWVSFIHPMTQLAITPWNPPPGLSLFLLLRFGLRYVPALYVAAYLADVVVRGAPPGALHTLASCLVLASGYAAAGALLVRTIGRGRNLRDLRELNWLVATGLAAPLAVALAYVGLHALLGELPAGEIVDALWQFWVGDSLGIIVTTPLLLEFAERRVAARARVDAELLLQAGAILLALWIVFGIAATDEFKYFYLLFLPIIWIAMRRGFRGAIVASAAMQLGLIAAGDDIAAKDILLRDLQLLMLTLALTALYLGMVVSERAEAQQAIAARDAALNRALRMASAGELAATIAHELNQPLSAIGTYVRACQLLVESPRDDVSLHRTLEKVSGEVVRAGSVITRLRDFYRFGSTRREPVEARELVAGVVESLAPRLAQHRVAVEVSSAPETPRIGVDKVQMQMVVHNLLANAVEAIAAGNVRAGRIRVRLEPAPEGMLSCVVSDNGPGLSAAIAGSLFEPFTTTKTEGMGLGLAMSRSIVEAHGGELVLVSSTGGGATFRLTLPAAEPNGHEARV